jgi:hypothetical protein
MHAQPFVHQPLSAPNRQIRLVRMAGAGDNGPKDILDHNPIRCSIDIYDIDVIVDGFGHVTGCSIRCPREQVTYTALSYTWGKEHPLQAIVVNDRSFNIRTSLYQFLELWRAQDDSGGLLWVDQLCIDQGDLNERSQQVQLMSAIYAKAKEVHAWLGPATEYSTEGLELLNRYQTNEYHNPMNHGPGPVFSSASRSAVLGLQQLLSCTYWTRLWVVQEVYLARVLVLRCGSDSVHVFLNQKNIDAFCFEIKHAVRGPHEDCWHCWMAPGPSAFFVIRDRVLRRKTLRRRQSYMSLRQALDYYAERNCSEPRDRIFGLQACVRPESRITVDYTKTASTLLHEVAQKLRFGGGHGSISQIASTLIKLQQLLGLNQTDEASLKALLIRWKWKERHVDPFTVATRDPGEWSLWLDDGYPSSSDW